MQMTVLCGFSKRASVDGRWFHCRDHGLPTRSTVGVSGYISTSTTTVTLGAGRLLMECLFSLSDVEDDSG